LYIKFKYVKIIEEVNKIEKVEKGGEILKEMGSLEVAIDIRDMITKYLGRELDKELLKKNINKHISTNNRKIFNGATLTPTFSHKLGKKRLEVFNEILSEIESIDK